MTQAHGVVVVGAGLAAAKLVEALRKGGGTQSVLLLGDEGVRPYERPGLSKEVLLGKAPPESLYVHDEGWYAEHDVEVRFADAAVGIDRAAHTVRLSSGDEVGYERLVLATGAAPRTLELPGADLAGVHTLRTREDNAVLKAAMTGSERWVIVGGGWIGLEVAAAARLAGCEVTVLERDLPLVHVLGEQLAEHFTALHRSHGVDVRTGASVEGIEGAAGQVTGVRTSAGVLPADHVLIAVGAAPRTGLASDAGLEVDGGVVVDSRLRTSDPAVLAIGDVANAEHAVLARHLRVEHWDNAIRQGRLVASTLLDGTDVYDWAPYFYTDQYDLGMEYVGHADPADRLVVRGEMASGEFIAFWLGDDGLSAAMHVNVWDTVDDLRALWGRRDLDEARLADPGVPLGEL